MGNELAKLNQATKMLAEAKTLDEIKHILNIAEAARTYAKAAKIGLEAYNHAAEVKARAERKAGQFLAQLERGAPGVKPQLCNTVLHNSTPSEYSGVLEENDISRMQAHRWQQVSKMADEVFESHINEMKGERPISTVAMVKEILKASIHERITDLKKKEISPPTGIYDVVVIDPPWPMEKIERDVRPNQVSFDYPTMSENELSNLKIPCTENAHIFLWTTHKFLPMALRLLENWGLKYVCCFVWHKPGGPQPFGLPQYNCEFVLYARRGTPIFTDVKAFNTCFNGDRGKHSEKPEEFYSMVSRVTSGQRLDMFSRRKIDGFCSWGNEAA